jgi:hypothetical protein
MTLDVPLLRSDTPGVANVLHFNNAGVALPPRPVLDAVMNHLTHEAAIGGYEAAAEEEGRIADVYDAVAASGGQLGFTRASGGRQGGGGGHQGAAQASDGHGGGHGGVGHQGGGGGHHG